MSKPNGGPAFPIVIPADDRFSDASGDCATVEASGMSLRDYFAAKAMQAEMITSFSDSTPGAARAFHEGAAKAGHTIEEHLAFNSYRIADAMLAERAK